MPTGYQIKDQSAAHYLTFRVVYWIDLFTRPVYRDIIIESFQYCQKEKGLELYAWVIMSNHIHLLAKSSKNDLSGTIRDFKKFTSKVIIELISTSSESRKEWMLRLFAHAAKRQNKAVNFRFGRMRTMLLKYLAIPLYRQKLNIFTTTLYVQG